MRGLRRAVPVSERLGHLRGCQARDRAPRTPTGLSPEPTSAPIALPAPVRWEDLDNRADCCPRCLHWWGSHGVPGEDGYGCGMPTSSMDERERGIFEVCGCTFAEGNTITPRQARIWHDGTVWPLAPWERANCGHVRRGPMRPDRSHECLDCGAVLASEG